MTSTPTLRSVVLLGALSLSLSMPSISAAVSLYWSKGPVRASSPKSCFEFANKSMHDQGFQNIRRSNLEVAGSRQGVYASVTCIGTTPKATVVVMAAGDDALATTSARDVLFNQITRMVIID